MTTTGLACPACGNTDVSFDWDAVITAKVEDGRLVYVNLGGVLGAGPDRLHCGSCDTYAEAAPIPAEIGGPVNDLAESALDPAILELLVDGGHLWAQR